MQRVCWFTVLVSGSVWQVACSSPPAVKPAQPVPPQISSFCSDLTKDPNQLCSAMPHSIHRLVNGYSGFSSEGQLPFDNFAWQELVALNWPANADGTPNNAAPFTTDWSKPRVWDYYMEADQVFPQGLQPFPAQYPTAPIPPRECQWEAPASTDETFTRQSALLLSKGGVIDDPAFFEQAVVNLPLIDRNLNYAVYELAVNWDEWNYLKTTGLWQKSAQQGATITLPPGSYADPTTQTGGPVGAIELKATWRILDPAKGDDPSRYFIRPGRIYVPASATEKQLKGSQFCTPTVTLGLVGLHVIHQVAGEINLMWSTFEHVDNAPDTSSGPSDPTCAVPAGAGLMSFFNPACRSAGQPCVANIAPTPINQRFYWNREPPYALAFATSGAFGTQVVRCTPLYAEADAQNRRWWAKLQGTPWVHYKLVGTQWATQIDAPPFPVVNLPTYLQNTVAETYLQKGSPFGQGSCLDCHAAAKTAAGGPADFSFLFARAR